jgi:hypothetical protein
MHGKRTTHAVRSAHCEYGETPVLYCCYSCGCALLKADKHQLGMRQCSWGCRLHLFQATPNKNLIHCLLHLPLWPMQKKHPAYILWYHPCRHLAAAHSHTPAAAPESAAGRYQQR